jgi:hypothetical protein
MRCRDETKADFTDQGLAKLADLPLLEDLAINVVNPEITTKGVEALGQLKTLRRLSLSDVPVGKAGLDALGGLINLEELDLYHTHCALRI